MREHPGSFIAGILFVVIGAAFLGESFGWWTVAVASLWPVVLLAAGAVILLNATRSPTDGE